MTDFAKLLWSSLPGIYRQRDEAGELARFLEIMASPLAELEASIGQLYDDRFGATARVELLPLIGALIGAELDASLPESLQRAALEDTLASHRTKGLASQLARAVQASSGWPTVAVDYSQRVARVPYLETASPLLRRRGRPVGVAAGGSGRFYVDATGMVAPLYDELRGRAIARAELATLGAELIGTDRGFAIRERGVDLVGPRAPAPRNVVAADLTDFASPKAPSGTPLALSAGDLAIDPELGRLLFAAPVPLAGNLTVDFYQLVPASIAAQTLDLRDPARVAELGRSNDRAPYALDLRAAAHPRARIGRTHFDNHGFFVTPARRFEGRRPNRLLIDAHAFSFDDRALAPDDAVGVTLQLLDGLDGSPLTRAKLHAAPGAFVDMPRGFSITARGVSLLDPAFGSDVRVVAATLFNADEPQDWENEPLTLQPRDIAVDPQLGRFWLDLDAFGVAAAELRVSYALANVARVTRGTALRIDTLGGTGPSGTSIFSFFADGRLAALCDALDGTPIRTKLRLEAELTDFHGTPRGYDVIVEGDSVLEVLIPQLATIDGPVSNPGGLLMIDLERGRFALSHNDVPHDLAVFVDYSAADAAAEARVFDSLAQRLPRLLPAGVEPVVVDTRSPTLDLRDVPLAGKAI